jgi:hypothetical protein
MDRRHSPGTRYRCNRSTDRAGLAAPEIGAYSGMFGVDIAFRPTVPAVDLWPITFSARQSLLSTLDGLEGNSGKSSRSATDGTSVRFWPISSSRHARR